MPISLPPITPPYHPLSLLQFLQLASSSSSITFGAVAMDLVSPTEHLCYVRCTYCNIVLAVGVPCKRMLETVTVKCGHCNHLSFLSPRPMLQSLINPTDLQGACVKCTKPTACSDCLRGQPLAPPLSSASSEQGEVQKPPFVVKPPEKKHRMPSAYNRFMKDEIQRIKAAKPDIPHREAFSMAAKNWAKCDPRCSTVISISDNTKLPAVPQESTCSAVESSNVYNHMEQQFSPTD